MIEVIKLENGFYAYRGAGIYQEFHPEKEGYEPMTEAEAQAMAAIITARMSG